MIRYGINLKWQPEIMTLKNYYLLFTGKEGIYLHWYKNSVLITCFQTFCCGVFKCDSRLWTGGLYYYLYL